MEASTLHAPAALARPRIAIGTPLLRLRSDDQLVALFRAGHDEAFGAIHERYHKRLLAYARQMLPQRQDAEDALQDVFVRAYSGLRVGQDQLLLRPWLFRVAHNRCIDELRRPTPPPPEVMELLRSPVRDPIAVAEQRESLRRLIEDVRRLPGQQRSALLMRELAGLTYAELATALGVSLPAVKSLLVRARVSLAEAAQARDMDCNEIRDEIAAAHDRGTRPNSTARKHLRDCTTCRTFRRDVRGFSRRYAAALIPAVGPFAALAHMLGFSGGAGGGATATAGGATATASSATATASAAVGGTAVTGGVAAAGATGHLATLLAAAVATAGGAVGLQHTIAATSRPSAHGHAATAGHAAHAQSSSATSGMGVSPTQDIAPVTNPAAIERMRSAAASASSAERLNGGVQQGSGGAQGSLGSKHKRHVASGGAATADGGSDSSSLLAGSTSPTGAEVVSGSSSTTTDPSASSCSTSSTSSTSSTGSTSSTTSSGTSTTTSASSSGSNSSGSTAPTSSDGSTTTTSTTSSTSSGTASSPDTSSTGGTSGSGSGSSAPSACGTSSSQSAATPT